MVLARWWAAVANLLMTCVQATTWVKILQQVPRELLALRRSLMIKITVWVKVNLAWAMLEVVLGLVQGSALVGELIDNSIKDESQFKA